MSVIGCKECGKQISSGAKACPECGAKPPYRPGLGIIIFFITVLFFGLQSISSNPASTAPSPLRDPSESARGACMLFIKQTLHDPDSADFGVSSDSEVTHRDNIWIVRRQVRGKNAFNAKRLAVFECKMREEGMNWVPLSVRQIDK